MGYTRKEKIGIGILFAISILTHFAWFGHPNTTVFDEVHFGKFISSYFTHEYYFDIHPPLGKLILAGWGNMWGFQPGFSFANIGDMFPDRTYLALRFLPSLAGALLPLVLFGIARQLRMSYTAALFAGGLVALDNALIVQSRLILLDSFLLLFGCGAVWSYLRWRNGGTPYFLAVAGILGGMAIGIKWTGATFLALIGILELLHLWQDRHTTALRRIAPVFVALVILPFLMYYTAFMIHFRLLNISGSGDAFMTREFQHDLRGNQHANDPSIQSIGSLEKFSQLNAEMYRSNQRLTATHPYGSAWYSWPLMQRPIFYWVEGTSRIYLMGNPVVWWLSTAAVLTIGILILFTGIARVQPLMLMFAGVWLMNILPFIGITRVMFLYHYFIALLWAVLMLAFLVDRFKKPERAALVIGALALMAFLFFAPLTYGLPLSERVYNTRPWFSSWR